MDRANNIFLGRPDTMLGICEAVGRDLGFSPNILRLALGVSVMFNPLLVLGIYAALGVAVLATRLIWPSRAIAKPVAVEGPLAANDAVEPELALAA